MQFYLSMNKIAQSDPLEGEIVHEFKNLKYQTIREKDGKMKWFPVRLVEVETKNPTRRRFIIDKEAIISKTKSFNAPRPKWLYIASKTSKLFHRIDSAIGARIKDGIKFETLELAQKSGRSLHE